MMNEGTCAMDRNLHPIEHKHSEIVKFSTHAVGFDVVWR